MGHIDPPSDAGPHRRIASNDRGRGIALDLRWLPPEPSRLIGLLEKACHTGITHVFLEFGENFPWSFDERFRGPFSYPEEVIAALDEHADRLETALVPVLPQLCSLENLLGISAYSHLRLFPQRCDIPDPRQPGYRNMQEEMIGDIAALLPRTGQVMMGTVSDGRSASEAAALLADGFADESAAFLLSVLRHARSTGLAVLIDAHLARFLRNDPQADGLAEGIVGTGEGAAAGDAPIWRIVACDPLDRVPANADFRGDESVVFAGTAGTESTEDLVPPELLCPVAAQLFGGNGTRPREEGETDRVLIVSFLDAVQEGWRIARNLREEIALATVSPDRRPRIGTRAERECGTLRDAVAAVRSRGRGIVERFDGRVAGAPLRRAVAARVEPLREELKMVEARLVPLFRY